MILEIRGGTGGDEAALFAGDLMRMYARYAALKGWTAEILSESEGAVGGYKEVVAEIRRRRTSMRASSSNPASIASSVSLIRRRAVAFTPRLQLSRCFHRRKTSTS